MGHKADGRTLKAMSAPTEPTSAPAQRGKHELAKYTVYRLLIAFGAGAVCYALGLRRWVLVLVALFIAGVVSFFLLNRQRDKASAAVYPGVQQIKNKLAQRQAAEDEAAEALRAEQEARRQQQVPDSSATHEYQFDRDGRDPNTDAQQNGEPKL